MVHFKEICGCEKAKLYEARIFKDGCFENRDEWAGGFNVHIQGEKADISLLDKSWSRQADRETAAFCRAKGVKTVHWERRGKRRKREL